MNPDSVMSMVMETASPVGLHLEKIEQQSQVSSGTPSPQSNTVQITSQSDISSALSSDMLDSKKSSATTMVYTPLVYLSQNRNYQQLQ